MFIKKFELKLAVMVEVLDTDRLYEAPQTYEQMGTAVYKRLNGIVQVAIALSSCLICPMNAMAQAQEPAGIEDAFIEEIVVTARKREENLQDTPMSVSAFTGESLELRGIDAIDKLQNVTPNLTFLNTSPFIAGGNAATMFLRGIGQPDFQPTTEPGVGIYVDGVYYGRTVGSVLNLMDFARVEVLRGPQGTLFGRNTIGGAINITTKRPTDELVMEAALTAGKYNRFDVKGTLSGPLADNLSGRLTVAKFKQDGFIFHETTGQDFGDKDELAARGALSWLPSANVAVNFTADYSTSSINGSPNTNGGTVFLDPGQFPPTGNFAYTHNVFLGMFTGCDGTPGNPGGSLDNPNCFNDQWRGRRAGEGPSFADMDTYGVNVTVDWNIHEGLALKTILSRRRVDAHVNSDKDHSPHLITSSLEDIVDQTQISTEFQLLGDSFDDRLNWIVGLYYFQEDGITDNPVIFQPVSLRSGGSFDHDSTALFAQGTYDISDQLHLTAGVRYTQENKNFLPMQFITENRTPNPGFAPGTRTLPEVNSPLESNDSSPHLSLSYDWNEELMTYLSYSEGFKGGGHHQRVFPPIIPSQGGCDPATPVDCIPTFRPEFVTSYELGFKFVGFDGRIRLNAAAFYSDYSDLQITVATTLAPILKNAGSATIRGFEIEGSWVPADSWLIEWAVGQLDTSYDSVDPATGLSGNEAFAWTPDWTISASVVKEFSLPGDLGTIVPRVDWSYRDKTWFDALNPLDTFQDSYGVTNANIVWENTDGRIGATLGVNNLADKDYLQLRFLAPDFGYFEDTHVRGRAWYLTFRLRY
ncbi:MAG: TonB-dependent receptor [Woeseiaceae bacterium]